MRIKVILHGYCLPIFYRHRIVSLIKEALHKSGSDYKENLYRNKSPRPFTFNLMLPDQRTIKTESIQIDKNFTVNDKVFYFDENTFLSLFLSSYDYQFVMNLFNGLMKMKTFSLSSDEDFLVNNQKIELQIKKVIPLNERQIKENELVFKTNSPIIIEDENDHPVLPDAENFNERLNYLQNKIITTVTGKGLKEPLEFIPVKLEKQVIKHTLKEFREKTGKPIMFLTGSKGIFKLKGHPEDLDFLYKTGIGNRTSQGFGMVEVIG